MERITWGSDGHGNDLDVIRELLDLFEQELPETVHDNDRSREVPCES